ncbi:MAG: cbb3-type cytochrome c oxidase subunit I [Thermomicrobiales bacterium]
MSAIAASLPGPGPIAPVAKPVDRFPPGQLWPIKLEFVLALVGLGLGGIVGLLQAIERVGWISSKAGTDGGLTYQQLGLQSYYQGLTLHGVLLALVFTSTFANGFLSLTTMRGFNRPMASTGLLQWSAILAATGIVLAAYAMLTNQASVLFTFYAPMQAHFTFYLGAALLVISTWLVSVNQLVTLRRWRADNPGQRIPLLAFASIATYLMWDLASIGIAVEVVFMLLPWSAGLFATVDPQLTRTLFWFTGHAIVYFWLLPAYISWYLLIPAQVGGKVYSDGMTRMVFILFLLFSVPTGIHHQFTDPGIPVWAKTIHYFATLIIFFPSVITAFSVMASLESAGRARGGKGLFGWIPKLPWGDPSVVAQLLAMLVFVLGGITGLINASYSLNKVVHNTAFVPGHFHLTVGTAVTLSVMGIAYWLTPYMTGHALWAPKLGVLQAWLWAIGVLIFARGQMSGGMDGMPRRSAIGEAGYLSQVDWTLANQLTAVGGIIMTVSGLLFFLVIVGTILRKQPAPLDVPISQVNIEAGTISARLDRFGTWFGLAFLLAALAYVPVLIGILPWNRQSPGQNVWGSPVFVPQANTILVLAYVLLVVVAFVWLWKALLKPTHSEPIPH